MSKFKVGDKLYEFLGIDSDSGEFSWEEITIVQVLDKISEDQWYLTIDIGDCEEDYSTHDEDYFSYMGNSKSEAIKNYLTQPHIYLDQIEKETLLKSLNKKDRKELVQYFKKIEISELEKNIDFKEKGLVKTKELIEKLKQELKTLKEGKG